MIKKHLTIKNHSDSKKRRCAMLFASGDFGRYGEINIKKGMMTDHIVYVDTKSKELEKILDGTKSMIIRGAAGRKFPYGRVFKL